MKTYRWRCLTKSFVELLPPPQGISELSGEKLEQIMGVFHLLQHPSETDSLITQVWTCDENDMTHKYDSQFMNHDENGTIQLQY